MVSGVAIAGLISAVALFGAVEFQDIPVVGPEAFTPTTIVEQDSIPINELALTLEETIPGIMDRLTMLTTNRDTIWTLAWDPSARAPRASVAVANKQMDWTSASFDTGGRLVAVLGARDSQGEGEEVRFGSPGSVVDTPRLRDVRSLKWHAVDVARLAFIRSVEDLITLEVVEIDFLTQTPKNPDVVRRFTELPRIIRWDNQGFILQMGNETVALDPQGNLLWRADGWARTSSPGFVPQVRQTDGGVRWFHIDRDTGQATSFADLGVNDDAVRTEIVTSKNTNIFAAATRRKEATTITVGGLSLIAPLTAYIFEEVSPYEFTSDAAFLILKSPESNDLTFLDWRAGTFHRLEVPDQGTVIAVKVD